VWLYYRFALSFWEIEELLASRGVTVSYEAIRLWCAKFGPEYARKLRHYRRQMGGCWHVEEVFIPINGTIHYLWRAVDQNGQIVDIPGADTARSGARGTVLSSSAKADGHCASYRDYGLAPRLLCRASSCPAETQTQTRALAE
jgi:hypothetical protein